VVPWFMDAARELLATVPGGAEAALARALAKITGHTKLRSRSLLTAHEDFTTLQFVGEQQIDRPGFVFGLLRRRGVPENTVEEVRQASPSCCGCLYACAGQSQRAACF